MGDGKVQGRRAAILLGIPSAATQSRTEFLVPIAPRRRTIPERLSQGRVEAKHPVEFIQQFVIEVDRIGVT